VEGKKKFKGLTAPPLIAVVTIGETIAEAVASDDRVKLAGLV